MPNSAARQSQHRTSLEPARPHIVVGDYHGGTHLPDVTVIVPFADADALACSVATRKHQADIGGITPGSMSADRDRIEQKDVRIDDVLLVDEDSLRETELRALLAPGAWPTRNPRQCAQRSPNLGLRWSGPICATWRPMPGGGGYGAADRNRRKRSCARLALPHQPGSA